MAVRELPRADPVGAQGRYRQGVRQGRAWPAEDLQAGVAGLHVEVQPGRGRDTLAIHPETHDTLNGQMRLEDRQPFLLGRAVLDHAGQDQQVGRAGKGHVRDAFSLSVVPFFLQLPQALPRRGGRIALR